MATNAPQGTADALLEVAERNLGFIEGPKNNENPFAPLVGHANFQPWCASFVAAVCLRAGVKIPNTSAYTPTMANGFKQQGRYFKSNPKRGDIVFFFWPNMGRIAHVGIVESVEPDGSIRTIEGNTNGGGSRTGGMVVRLVRKANIDGYGRPEFTGPTVTTVTKPTKTSKPVVATKKVNPHKKPVLTKERPDLRASGRKTNAEVKYVQWAVGAKDDGAWGAQTTKAVKAFQTHHKLAVDGHVGPKTLAKMETVRR
jgi:surface antigen